MARKFLACVGQMKVISYRLIPKRLYIL